MYIYIYAYTYTYTYIIVTDDDDDDDDDDDVKIDHLSSSLSPLSTKIIMCSLVVSFVTLRLQHTTTTTTTSASPPLDTMLNQTMMLVGVQAQEQLPGKWCCPRDLDGCKSYKTDPFIHYCNGPVYKKHKYKTLPNGTVCKPRIGGHCCSDSIAKQYHWQYVCVGCHTGCVKSSF